MIEQQKIGEVIDVGDAQEMASVILNYRDHPDKLEEEGRRARELILMEDFLPSLIKEVGKVQLSQ